MITTDAKKPLNRKLAVFLAVLVLWLVGGVGLGLMHARGWHFYLLGGSDAETLGQIGGYYLARIGAQIPALAFAAMIICLSNFRRPVRTACFITLLYGGIMTVIRLVRHPWAVAPDLHSSIPVLAEVAQLILMVAFVGFFGWLFIRIIGWLETGPLSRHFHH